MEDISMEGLGSDEEVVSDEDVTLIDDIVIPRARRLSQNIVHSDERLIIKHIVNINFKSYAGRVIVGPFNTNFSCIIGANGCGKSNLIDSLLFVFGFRSEKIRGVSVEKLIRTSPYVRSCTVEVHFAKIIEKSDGNVDVVPGSEFYLSRTAFINNTSCYAINGRKVRFKEVVSKLLENGVDLVQSRFLILQGDVEKIVSMQPKALKSDDGMLEYLDKIIGTVRYKDALDKLEKKLNELGDNKYKLFNELKLEEEKLDKLKEPMEKIILYLKTKNRVASLKNQKLQLELHQINIAAKEKEEERSKLSRKLERLNSKIKNGKKEERIEEEKIQKNEKNFNHDKETMVQLQDSLQHFNKELENLKAATDGMKKTRERNLSAIEKDKKKLRILEETIKELDEEETKLTQEFVHLSEEKENQTRILSAVKENVNGEIVEIQNEMNKLKAEENSLRDAYNKINVEYANKKMNLEHYQNNAKEKTNLNELNEVNEKIAEISENLKGYEPELERLIREKRDQEILIKELEKKVEPLRKQRSHLSAKLHKYEEEIRETEYVASNRRSNNLVLNYIMQRRSNNEIQGIFGRLGDLGGIDEKYDVAISTACGMLNYILVDLVQTMTMCFKALEKDNIGRASFISLEKIEHLRSKMNIPIKTPENVPRLFDLVKVTDERVLPAFYFVLRDTLVAKDLKQAQRIAYDSAKRYRVVSLDGSLIELSGTMSGGGSTVYRGLMGRQVAVNTVDSSIQELQQKKKLDEIKVALNLVESDLKPLEEKLTEEMIQISKLDRNIESTKTIIQDLKAQHKVKLNRKATLDKVLAHVKRDDVKFRSLKNEAERYKKESEVLEKNFRDKENEVKEIKKKIKQIITERTKNECLAFDTVNEKWETVDKDLTKVKGKKNGIETSIKECKENIRNNEKKLEQGVTNEKKYFEKEEILNKDRDIVTEKIENLQPSLKERENELKTLKEKRSQILQKIESRERKKLTLQPQLKSVVGELSTFKKPISDKENELKKLVLHEIPELFKDDEEFEDEEEEEIDEDAMEVDEEIDNDETNNTLQSPVVLLKYTPEELGQMNEERIQRFIDIENNFVEQRGDVEIELIGHYKNVVDSYKKSKSKLSEISDQFSKYENKFQETKKKRIFEFQNAVNLISKKLKEVFRTLAPEGDAYLAFVDATDPYTEGVEYNVRPPSKTWGQISKLSGGEKTLSSLALIFALHYYKPTPFYVMDEIDAALDYTNVSIVARYIRERTKNAQFIIVSLRTKMFEVGRLITGVTKIDDCTRVCGLQAKYYADRFSGNSRMETIESSDEEDESNVEPMVCDNENIGSPPMFDSDE